MHIDNHFNYPFHMMCLVANVHYMSKCRVSNIACRNCHHHEAMTKAGVRSLCSGPESFIIYSEACLPVNGVDLRKEHSRCGCKLVMQW